MPSSGSACGASRAVPVAAVARGALRLTAAHSLRLTAAHCLLQSRAAERQRLTAAHDEAMRANASLEAQVKELGTRRHDGAPRRVPLGV